MLCLHALQQLPDARVNTWRQVGHTWRQVGHVPAEVRPPQNDVVEYQTHIQCTAAPEHRHRYTSSQCDY